MKRQLTLMVLILVSTLTFGQTIGGNFYIFRTGEMTVRAVLKIYNTSTLSGGQPVIDWGDGNSDTLITSVPTQDTYYNILTFIKYHTYQSNGVYNVSISDNMNLIEVVNVENSEQKSLTFNIQYDFSNIENMPAFFPGYAIDWACTDSVYSLNPEVYDVDGDSLVYELIPCIDSTYTFPTASIGFNINSETGTILWDKPVETGNHIIAYLVKEFRNGLEVGFVVRVMTINVSPNAGVTDQSSIDKKTMIYPNPFTTEIFVKSSDKIKSVEIYNVLGIMTKKIECSPMFDLSIETSDLNKGAYFVKVIDEFGSFETYKLTR